VELKHDNRLQRQKGGALRLNLDHKSEIPIYVQLKGQLRYAIQSGQLEPGSQLSTMRELAVELGIDANTVARVYRELEDEGLIERQQGRSTFVRRETKPKVEAFDRAQAKTVLSSATDLLKGMNLTSAEVADLLRDFADRLEKE
jgi:GntR family transcriptional regulator